VLRRFGNHGPESGRANEALGATMRAIQQDMKSEDGDFRRATRKE
jgi:hypothetical protein